MLYLVFTSLVWAFSYGLIKTKLGGLDANFITFCRMGFALLVFLPFLRIKNLPKRHIFSLMSIGAIQYGVMYLCFLRSFQYLDAYQAALFTTFTPLYVILINDLYAKKFNPYYLKIAAIAVLGGAVIYYKNIIQPNIVQGFLLVQVADLCFAYGQVAYKRLRTTEVALKDQNIYALLFLGALLVAVIATTMFSGWSSAQIISGAQISVLAYLGAVASGICFFLWNKGGVTTNTATLAVFNNLKSPLAIVISLVFFNESTDVPRLIMGLGLICVALYMAERHARTFSAQAQQTSA